MIKLKVDEDFKRLIPPLSPEELLQLEQNIIRDGCREPLSIWNNIVLDGHNRYSICTKWEIPFLTQRINVKNKEEAVVWICSNQLGRRNIADETRKYLIGKRYETEKIIGAHNMAGTNQYTKKEVRANTLPEPPFGITARRTRERLAEEYHISHASVLTYGIYSQAVDSLSEIVPELVPRLLSGEIKVSQENTIGLSKLTGQEAKCLIEIVSGDALALNDIAEVRRLYPGKHISRKPALQVPAGSIKEMPSHDPDAEISSLALTIPSWVSSVNRVKGATNIEMTSVDARIKLKYELTELLRAIGLMMEIIKEAN